MTEPPPISLEPNVLRDAAAPNVLWSSVPGEPPPGTGPRTSRATALTSIVLILVVVVGVAVPLVMSSAVAKDPCTVVDELIASGEPEVFDVSPQEWMPARVLPGYEVTSDGGLSLEMVVAGRVNPEESRVELTRDLFVDGYQQEWEGATDGVGFTAQRFATGAGAQDFHAFANRFACQFANETFPGPHGSIGLQIRYRGGDIGEQVSWVSGTTRILVSFIQEDAPADHSKIEALAALIPNG